MSWNKFILHFKKKLLIASLLGTSGYSKPVGESDPKINPSSQKCCYCKKSSSSTFTFIWKILRTWLKNGGEAKDTLGYWLDI